MTSWEIAQTALVWVRTFNDGEPDGEAWKVWDAAIAAADAEQLRSIVILLANDAVVAERQLVDQA